MAKKRLRKNDLESEPHDKIKGSGDARYIATMINPVDHRLYDIVSFSESIYVVAPMPNELYSDEGETLYVFGDGSYDSDDSKDIEYEDTSGTYFRSHTPGGVVKKKSGLGLLLYSGLSLAAVLLAGVEGVFSEMSERSSEATAWWKAQARRGYAVEDLQSTSLSGGVSLASDDLVEGMDKEDIFGEEARELENVEIDEVDPSYVEVQVYGSGEQLVQFLPAWKVAESGLIVAWDEDDSDLNSLMESDRQKVPIEVLAELDMSTTADPTLIRSIWELLNEDPNITKQQLKRWLNTLPESALKLGGPRMLELFGQQRLPLDELLEETREVAANPRKPKKHSKDWKDFFGDLVIPT